MRVINKLAASLALVTAVVGSQAQATNLIVNGNFATGDFTGWTYNDTGYPMYIVASPVVAPSVYAAQIAGYSYHPDTLSQTVADTAGLYDLSFWVYQSGGQPSGLIVTWDGTQILSQIDPSTVNVYQNFSLNVVGTGSDTLVFTDWNDPSFTYLDNVSLTAGTATPLPSTWTMLIAGFVGLGFLAYRGSKNNAASIAAA